jgi:thiosulfate dehydrogenase [quinone] large subunit
VSVKLQTREEQDLTGTVWDHLRGDAVILVPLRLFIGVGWLRAGVEKLVAPEWYGGDGVREFIRAHIENGQAPFPAYEFVMREVLFPLAIPIAVVVLFTQLLIGLMILLGLYTGPALIWGMFLNLNFILCGAVNPSVFYIVIQVVLLRGQAGEVLGLDGLMDSPQDRGFRRSDRRVRRRIGLSVALLLLALAMWAGLYLDTLDPELLVEDAAAVTVMLLMLGSLWSALDALR